MCRVNSSKHASTGETPFKLNYGYEPATPLSLIREPEGTRGQDRTAVDFVAEQRRVMAEAKDKLALAQERMAKYVAPATQHACPQACGSRLRLHATCDAPRT